MILPLRSSQPRKITVLPIMALLMAASPLAAQVVINEVDYDQPSTDNAEFLELKNTGTVPENLDPYTVELVNGTGGGAAVYNSIDLPNVILAPGDYFVICANAATVANCDLDDSPNTNFIQNGAPDAVGLRQSGSLVDAVSYEGDAGAPYTEGSGAGLVDNSAIADSGISRCADGTDTNQNNVDFAFTAISPGAGNDCPGPTLVINEIDYDQPSTDAAEFVEIKNVGSSPVALGGIDLQLVNGTGGGATVYNAIALPAVSLAAGDHFVVCANTATVANCDLDSSPNTNFIQNGSPDAVALVQGGTIIDAVSYEGDTGVPYTEGSGSGLEDNSSSADMGISRCSDGTDTDQNNADLIYVGITPGASNDCGGPAGGDLVINEVDYDQPSSDTAEFIEIYNNDTVGVSLSGFSLELVNGTGGGASVYQTIALPGVTLTAGDYFVVCANAATVANCDLDAVSSIQNGAPDAVALLLGGVILDTVSYEGNTGVPYTEFSGSGLQDPGTGGVGGGNDNKSISRLPDGFDTDQNNVDFRVVCATPGSANTTDASSCPSVAPPNLVINEVDYDQPSSDTAEFVEIVNNGQGPADLAGIDLLVINGSGGGASIARTIPLPGIVLGAGDYFVVCGSAFSVANCDLDVSPDSNLIQNGPPDAVALVLAGTVLDSVSYEGDTGAPYTEGSGSGLEDSGATGQDFRSIGRFPDGSDTNQNNVNFSNACITPGAPNTSLTVRCTALAPLLEIYEIQGSGVASLFDGQTIRTENNVVTAVGADQFAMQTPEARSDGDIDTSDGIMVFTGSAPTVAVGDVVTVTGTVIEFFGLTEFTGGSLVELVSSGNPVPSAVALGATVPTPNPLAPTCAIEFECFEGMLIEIAEGTVTGPNQRFGVDPVAEVHITAAPTRTFREPGVEFPGVGVPPIPTWDGNPEVFELDPDKLGLPNQIIPAGSSFSATGVLGFEFGGYEFWPSVLTVDPAPLPVAVRGREPGELTVGTLNLFRLFDDFDDPADGDRDDFVVSTAEYQRRLGKFSAYIVEVLDAPDILAVQEVESMAVLGDLAARIEDDASVVYTAIVVEGNDIGTIDVGFLVRGNITVDAVTQIDPDATFINPITLGDDILHDRPPLLLEGSCELQFGTFPIAVMAVHNRSLGGIDGSEGERVRKKRLLQAESIAMKVQDLQTADPDVRLVVTGDFNAFEFTDGYVDSLSVIAGDFDPSMSFVCTETACTGDLVEPNLDNQVLGLDAGERYSFIFRGNAQVLDHALTSSGLAAEVSGVQFGRGNADAAVDLINDDGSVDAANKPLRSSDHDGLVVYITKDEDADGVPNDGDVCPATVIRENVPTNSMGTNRFALTDEDGVFDTKAPKGKGPKRHFDIGDTAGCSCEQIIEAQGLGNGHTKFGCSISAMDDWVELVTP